VNTVYRKKLSLNSQVLFYDYVSGSTLRVQTCCLVRALPCACTTSRKLDSSEVAESEGTVQLMALLEIHGSCQARDEE
jgi:hypothetical protein